MGWGGDWWVVRELEGVEGGKGRAELCGAGRVWGERRVGCIWGPLLYGRLRYGGVALLIMVLRERGGEGEAGGPCVMSPY